MAALAESRESGNLVPFETLIADYVIATLKKRIALLKQNEENLAQARKETRLDQQQSNAKCPPTRDSRTRGISIELKWRRVSYLAKATE